MSPSSWCWICVIIQQDWINANWLDCVDALAKLIPIQRHLAERLSELGMLHPTTLVDGWLTGSVKSRVIWFLQGIFSIDLFSKALELSQEARAENPCKEVYFSSCLIHGLRFIPDENTESSESEVNKLEKCQDTHTEKKTKIATQSRWKKRGKEMTFIQI